MKKTSLSLTLAYPEHINIETDIEGAVTRDYDVTCELEIGQNKEQERIWRVCVDAKFGGKENARTAHRGRVRYVGFFSVSDDVDAEKMGRVISVTGPSVLYSSIRELVALLTGRGPGPCVLLPVVTFLDNVLTTASPSPEGSDQPAAKKLEASKRRRRQERRSRKVVHRALNK